MNTEIVQVGRIDESGYLNGFGRRGFTFPKCILELIANILDAMENVEYSTENPPTILFEESHTHTRLIDNASGMGVDAATNMFAMHRENHAGTPRRGVSGIGAKPSLSILSNKTDVQIYTHTHNGPYLKIIVPWAQIHREGKYTGMVSIQQMSDIEITEFNNERACNKMLNASGYAIGTTIVFKNNDKLHNVIEDNFTIKSDLQNPLDRISVVFGRENVNILYRRAGDTDARLLQLYNYFDGLQSNYYKGINEEVIEQWNSRTTDDVRFIWSRSDGEDYEIEKKGRGYATTISEVNNNLSGFKRVGKYTITTSMRYDPAIFNSEAPAEITAEDKMNTYDAKYLDSENKINKNYLTHYKLVRNNQVIGLIAPPDISTNNARANGQARFYIQYLQTYILFNPVSTQNNPQDEVMGIQENKNQFNGDSIPKNFTRLVRAIRESHGDCIWNYFTTLIDSAKKKPANESAKEDVTDDTEEDAKDDAEEDAKAVETTEEATEAAETTEEATGVTEAVEATEEATGATETTEEATGATEVEEATEEATRATEAAETTEEATDATEKATEEATEDATDATEETNESAKKPVNVTSYRKHAVTGKELIEQLNTLLATVSSDTVYTDSSVIELYNKLSSFKVPL